MPGEDFGHGRRAARSLGRPAPPYRRRTSRRDGRHPPGETKDPRSHVSRQKDGQKTGQARRTHARWRVVLYRGGNAPASASAFITSSAPIAQVSLRAPGPPHEFHCISQKKGRNRETHGELRVFRLVAVERAGGPGLEDGGGGRPAFGGVERGRGGQTAPCHSGGPTLAYSRSGLSRCTPQQLRAAPSNFAACGV